jgi:signal peptidase
MNEDEKRKTPLGILITILGVILMIIPFVVSVGMLVPKVMGYTEYTVVTASMEPELPVGSLILVKEIDPATLAEGDVVTYSKEMDPNTVITHRVVENDTEEGQVITKGDANEVNDMEPVKYDFILGKMEASFPKVGVPAAAAGTLTGKIFLAAMLITGYLLTVIASRLRR